MVLDQFRTQTLIWDKANKSIFEKVKAHQGDSDGRKLRVQVLNNGTVEDLKDVSLNLAWKDLRGDASGLDAFEIVDTSKGIFEIKYTRGMLANEGNLKASLVLIDSGRIESDSFTIEMMKTNVDDNSVQSENSFTALTRALVDVSKLEDNYAPRLNEVTAQLAQTDRRIDDIITTPAEGISQEEIIDARKGRSSLGSKISDVDERISNIDEMVYDSLYRKGQEKVAWNESYRGGSGSISGGVTKKGDHLNLGFSYSGGTADLAVAAVPKISLKDVYNIYIDWEQVANNTEINSRLVIDESRSYPWTINHRMVSKRGKFGRQVSVMSVRDLNDILHLRVHVSSYNSSGDADLRIYGIYTDQDLLKKKDLQPIDSALSNLSKDVDTLNEHMSRSFNYLYQAGHEAEDILGAWVVNNLTGGTGQVTEGGLSKEENYLQFKYSYNNGTIDLGFSSDKKIDVTDVDVLYIDWEQLEETDDHASRLQIADTKHYPGTVFVKNISELNKFERKTTELDVRDLEGEYYLRIHSIPFNSSGKVNLKVHNVYTVGKNNLPRELNERLTQLENQSSVISNITHYYPTPAKSVYTTNSNSNHIGATTLHEGVLWGHTGGRVLYKSSDLGKTWENAGQVINESVLRHIEILSNGYALLFLNDGKVLKSKSTTINGSTAWEHVMTSAEPLALRAWYGLSVHDNVIFFNGYNAGSNATEAYLSLDYGDTWETVFDMPHLGEETNNHTHDSEYDPYTGWLWVATGDTIQSKNIYYSKDMGETWESIWKPGEAPLQFTSITARPESVIFGTDWATDWGVWRYDKKTGKIESIYQFGEHHLDSAIAVRPFNYEKDGKVVTFIPFMRVQNDIRWHLIATADGLNYYMYSYGENIGEGNLMGILGVQDGKIIGKDNNSVYVFDEPKWNRL